MGVAEVAMSFMPYGPRWRTHRKLFNDFISLSTVENYDSNQTEAVTSFLINLHKKPKALKENIELCAFHLHLIHIPLTYGAILHPDSPVRWLSRFHMGFT